MRLFEVFCLGFIDQGQENYILYKDQHRSNEDISKILERFPEAIIQNQPYLVKACEDTNRRICDNNGKLVCLNQKIPKPGDVC